MATIDFYFRQYIKPNSFIMKNIKTYLTVVSIFVASAAFSQITVNEVVTNPTCFGDGNGSVDLSVTGGTAPYTFLWSNGADSSSIAGLFPGLYTVSISDNGTVVDSVFNYTVTDPTQLSAAIINSNNLLVLVFAMGLHRLRASEVMHHTGLYGAMAKLQQPLIGYAMVCIPLTLPITMAANKLQM